MKKLVAEQKMREFDPECERHFPLLIVKAADPGCTLEVQIENAVSGEITRITSTESTEADKASFEKALLKSFWLAWHQLNSRRSRMSRLLEFLRSGCWHKKDVLPSARL